MDNCIFCKIKNGEINSKKFYEDEDFFIIADVNPKAKKHYLMIPNNHYALLNDANANDLNIIGKMLKKLTEISSSLGLDGGYRLIINQGKNGGQEVPHLHIHVLGGERLD